MKAGSYNNGKKVSSKDGILALNSWSYIYAVCIRIFTWIHKLKNRHFTVFCDNNSAVNMLNHTTSRCKYCMTLIQKQLQNLCSPCKRFIKWFCRFFVKNESLQISKTCKENQQEIQQISNTPNTRTVAVVSLLG